MMATMLQSEYSGAQTNTLYKDTDNVVLMDNEVVQEEKKWSVTRKYKGMFSCEEAIRRLLEIHANTEEEE